MVYLLRPFDRDGVYFLPMVTHRGSGTSDLLVRPGGHWGLRAGQIAPVPQVDSRSVHVPRRDFDSRGFGYVSVVFPCPNEVSERGSRLGVRPVKMRLVLLDIPTRVIPDEDRTREGGGGGAETELRVRPWRRTVLSSTGVLVYHLLPPRASEILWTTVLGPGVSDSKGSFPSSPPSFLVSLLPRPTGTVARGHPWVWVRVLSRTTHVEVSLSFRE